MNVFLLIFGGLLLLVFGAELLVRGSSRLATAAKIPSLIIGLTIVAFGTSSPELVVSISASLQAQPDIAIGNVIGSNIFNVLFILGISSIITPLAVTKQLIRLDVPIMIVVSIAVTLMGLSGRISPAEGAVLFSGIILYVGFLVFKARREGVQNVAPEKHPDKGRTKVRSIILMIVLIIIGLVMLVAGSKFLVDGAVKISEALGVSKLVIALTIVAVGTSLPELATSVVASIHGEKDIAVGNIIGSNIFNILAIIGLSAMLSPEGGISVSHDALSFDLPMMTAVAIACLPIFYTKNEISRCEGAIFLLYYLIYLMFLIFTAKGKVPGPVLTGIVLYLVIPFTGLIFLISILRSLRQTEKLISRMSDAIYSTFVLSYSYVKKIIILTVGLTILLAGLAMIFLPGPGMLVMLLGVTLLAIEFAFFKNLQKKIKDNLIKAKDRIYGTFKE
ncbi:MAG: calcium/sodium antiporter [Pseudomonadota bacterium]